MRVDRLAIALGMLSALACGRSQPDATSGPGVSTSPGQVKPAEARPTTAPAEALADPGQEPGELPRGVSAPQPEARDLVESNTEPTSSGELASAAVPKASAKPKPAMAAPLQLGAKDPATAKPERPHSSVASPKPSEKVAPAPPPVVEPAVPVVPPPPPPAPKASVTVPHTDHVHVEVPAGLQHWLDEDDRMRPWLGTAVGVADSCFAKVRAEDPNASGAISFVVTMHENARPSGSVSSVSGPLNSMVMCATRGLLGVKMPLFTGSEGESYSVRVRFDP